MALKQAQRRFIYDQMVLEDINPAMSVEQIRDHYAEVYPELTQAEIDGPKNEDGKMVYEFEKAVGTKGVAGKKITITQIASGSKFRSVKKPALTRADMDNIAAFAAVITSDRSDTSPSVFAPSDAIELI